MGDNSAGSNIWGYDTRVVSATLSKPYVDVAEFKNPIPYKHLQILTARYFTPGEQVNDNKTKPDFWRVVSTGGTTYATMDYYLFPDSTWWSGSSTIGQYVSDGVYTGVYYDTTSNWSKRSVPLALPDDVIGPIYQETTAIPSAYRWSYYGDPYYFASWAQHRLQKLNGIMGIPNDDVRQVYGYVIGYNWGQYGYHVADVINPYLPWSENPDPGINQVPPPWEHMPKQFAIPVYEFKWMEAAQTTENDGRLPDQRKFEYTKWYSDEEIQTTWNTAYRAMLDGMAWVRDYLGWASAYYYYKKREEDELPPDRPFPVRGVWLPLLYEYNTYWLEGQAELRQRRDARFKKNHNEVLARLITDPETTPVLPVLWDTALKVYAPYASFVGRKYEMLETVVDTQQYPEDNRHVTKRKATLQYTYDVTDPLTGEIVEHEGQPVQAQASIEIEGECIVVTQQHRVPEESGGYFLSYSRIYTVTNWYENTLDYATENSGSRKPSPLHRPTVNTAYHPLLRRFLQQAIYPDVTKPGPLEGYSNESNAVLTEQVVGVGTVYNGVTTRLETLADYNDGSLWFDIEPDSSRGLFPIISADQVDGNWTVMVPPIDYSTVNAPLTATIPEFIKEYRRRVPLVYTEGQVTRSKFAESGLFHGTTVDIVFYGPAGKGVFADWQASDTEIEVYGYLTLLWDSELMEFKYVSWRSPVDPLTGEPVPLVDTEYGLSPVNGVRIPRGNIVPELSTFAAIDGPTIRFSRDPRSANVVLRFTPPKWTQIKRHAKVEQWSTWRRRSTDAPLHMQYPEYEILKAVGLA